MANTPVPLIGSMQLAGATGEDCQAPFRWVPVQYWFHKRQFESNDAEFLSNKTE